MMAARTMALSSKSPGLDLPSVALRWTTCRAVARPERGTGAPCIPKNVDADKKKRMDEKLTSIYKEKLKKASAAGNAKEAALRYALAREALDVYLNDVELPPTFVPNEYVAPTDVTVPSLCQGSFCI